MEKKRRIGFFEMIDMIYGNIYKVKKIKISKIYCITLTDFTF